MQILLKGKCLISVCDSSVTILYVLYGTYMHRSRTSMELSAALATQLWLVSIDGRKAKSGQFNWPNDCNESDNRKSVAHCLCVCMCLCVCVYNAANRSDCQFKFYERAAGSSSIVNTFNTLMKAKQDTIYEYTASDIHTYIVFISIYVCRNWHAWPQITESRLWDLHKYEHKKQTKSAQCNLSSAIPKRCHASKQYISISTQTCMNVYVYIAGDLYCKVLRLC